MRCFKIIDAAGRSEVIYAKCRKDAIARYCEITGCPISWIKTYCTIRNEGAAANPPFK